MTATAFAFANTLTFFRLILAVLIWMVWQDGLYIVATILFGIACVTDLFDGYFAKAWGGASRFGAWFDPFADKIVTLTILFLLVWDGWLIGAWGWLCLLATATYDISSQARRTQTLMRGDKVSSASVSASRTGQFKTVVQCTTLGVLLLAPAHEAVMWAGNIFYAPVLLLIACSQYHYSQVHGSWEYRWMPKGLGRLAARVELLPSLSSLMRLRT